MPARVRAVVPRYSKTLRLAVPAEGAAVCTALRQVPLASRYDIVRLFFQLAVPAEISGIEFSWVLVGVVLLAVVIVSVRKPSDSEAEWLVAIVFPV
jgi:hypothetical protein